MLRRTGGSASGEVADSAVPKYRFAALAFDFDGVVVDSPMTHLAAWQSAFSHEGLDVGGIDILLREGGKDKDIAREIFSIHNNVSADEGIVARVCHRKQEIFDQMFAPKLVSGIEHFITELAISGYRLCLVSGTEARVVTRLLKLLSLEGIFDVLVTGDRLARAKPDPEGYRLAVSELRLEPSCCLAVENSPPGIRAALAAGLACVALQSSLSADFLSEAEESFSSATELADWFFRSPTPNAQT